MTLTTYNEVPVPSFMYGTAWKKEATSRLVQLAVAAGFKAIDTANQLIHYSRGWSGSQNSLRCFGESYYASKAIYG